MKKNNITKIVSFVANITTILTFFLNVINFGNNKVIIMTNSTLLLIFIISVVVSFLTLKDAESFDSKVFKSIFYIFIVPTAIFISFNYLCDIYYVSEPDRIMLLLLSQFIYFSIIISIFIVVKKIDFTDFI